MTPADHTMRCISLTIRARLRSLSARYRFREAMRLPATIPLHDPRAWWNDPSIYGERL